MSEKEKKSTGAGCGNRGMNKEELKEKAGARNAVIVRTSVIGILANVLLAVFKAVTGLAAGSIAIVLDAVNNLSDAASSLITIIGTKLASKQADKKHPYGYGRIEYLTAIIISVIVLYAGVTSLESSIKSIISPETPDYSAVSLVIVAAAVVVKILLGTYVKKMGKKVNSDSLVASGEDARLDSIISASTLVAAVIFLVSGVSLEAWLGAVISVVIIKSGIEMLKNTLSEILGERIDGKLAGGIKKTVCSFPNVYGAYDLVMHDYGPDRYLGSVHMEVPDYLTADDIDALTREIQAKVYLEQGVVLTAIGIYARNTQDNEEKSIYRSVRKLVMSHDHVLQMHGFYLDREKKILRFDIIISYSYKAREEEYQEIKKEVEAAYPDYHVFITLDADIS